MRYTVEATRWSGSVRPMKRGDAQIYDRGDETDWRLLIGNIGTFPNESNGARKMKLDTLKDLYTRSDAEILLMSEHNLNLHNTAYDQQPQNVMKKWVENSSGRFTNIKMNDKETWEDNDRIEYGGTGIMTNRRANAHVIDRGDDERQLGRWTWVTIRGKHNCATTIVSIYRPEKQQSTYSRQLARIRRDSMKEGEEILRNKEPDDLWFEDLEKLFRDKRKEGHEIIIAGDFNNNLNDKDGKVIKFMRQKLRMNEAMIDRYGKGPPTHVNGSTTIDGIFTTAGLHAIQGGYVSHRDSPSDHSWIWIDFKQAELVGENKDFKLPSITRRATAKIPTVKEKFNELLDTHVNQHKLTDKIEQVYAYAMKHQQLDRHHQLLYETIEERIQRGVKFADTNCRKVKRGKLPFSDKAQEIRGAVEIKRLIIRRIKLRGKPNRPSMSKVIRLASKYKYQGPKNFETLKEALSSLNKSYKEYDDFRPKAYEFRDTYLGRIANEMAERGKHGAEMYYKQLLQQEKQKEQARRVRRSEKQPQRAGVVKVDVEQDDGTLITIHDKEEIEKAIIKANTEKRQQSNNTPFREEPLQTLVGEQMDFDKWDAILRGAIKLPEEGIEEGTRLWYDYIVGREQIETPIFTWTTEEYFESWSKMPETKSCLPGIHTVHIKCIDHTTPSANVISKLALIPLVTGYAPLRWKQGIDSMIPKKVKGEHRPEKLRLILLMDARFNHNNKLIGKKMMEFGEKHGLLAEEQYGSRKAKSAIEHALNKRLVIDIARQQNRECVYIANDAKSCYDRILMMTAYLTMVQHGIPEKVAMCTVSCILEMEMKIRTKHGDSEVTYGGDKWIKLPHGCGQGNGYGPAIWACISSPLLNILRRRGHGINITSPITKEELTLGGISFVDDTDTVEMQLRDEAWNTLFTRTQRGLDLWESLLRATGGALEPSKSDWVQIRYKWKQGECNVVDRKGTEELLVRNPAGEKEKLTQKLPSEARETLGVWQNVMGTEEKQFKVLEEKIETWGDNVKDSSISRTNARWAVNTTIGKKVRYPLTATTLNDSQCHKLQMKLTKACYGKAGVVRTAPSILGAAPKHLGAMSLNTGFSDNQFIDHIGILLKHGHEKTTTGRLIRATAEILCIEAGIPGDPFSFDMEKITWITKNTWIQHTIAGLQKHDIQIESYIKGIDHWTNGDKFIMEEIAEHYPDSKSTTIINKVRMYLKANTVSDLLDSSGQYLCDGKYNVDEKCVTANPSARRYDWPQIEKPSRAEITLWKNAIKKITGAHDTTLRIAANQQMNWDVKSKPYTGWNQTYDDNRVYERIGSNQWKVWRTTNERGRRRAFTSMGETIDTLAECIKPCSVRITGDGRMYIKSSGRYAELTQETEAFDTIGWTIANSDIEENEEREFARMIEARTASIVSDGSYKDGTSSSAFVILPNKLNTGSNTVPGEKEDQNSYRSELAGILSSIIYTNEVCKRFSIQDGLCTHYCDNKGALSASFGWKRPNPRWASYDLVSLIRFHVQISPIQWKGVHVKGHQDDDVPYEDLDNVSQGNIDADNLAEEERLLGRNIDNRRIPGQPWKLMCDGKEVSGNYERRIRTYLYEDKMKNFWREKFGLTSEQADTIAWKTFQRSNTSCKDWERVWMMKYNSRIGGVRKNMKQRGHCTDDKCPCCEMIEDTDHIFICKNQALEDKYIEQEEKMQDQLQHSTSPEIAEAIIYVMRTFRYGENRNATIEWSDSVLEAANEQLQLGQRAFLGGWWSKKWLRAQRIYYEQNGKRNKPMIWLSKVIRDTQKIVREIWFERNEQLHKKETSAINQRRTQEANARIKQLFERKRNAVPHARIPSAAIQRHFKRQKEEALIRKTLRAKQKWIRDTEIILDIYEQSTAAGQSMRDYLCPYGGRGSCG